MEGYDYPTQHFGMMGDIALALQSLSVQILQHHYHYESFGSWWFSFTRFGEKCRVVYDGKDNYLRLEQNTEKESRHEWREVIEEHVNSQNRGDIVAQVIRLVGTVNTAGK